MADASGTYFDGGDTHWAPSTTFTKDGEILASGTEFVIENPIPGIPQSHYSIHLFACSYDPFDYGESDPPIPADTGGPIVRIEIRDAGPPEGGHLYFELTPSSESGDTSLFDFWNTLQSSGAKAALDQLIGDHVHICGSADTDYAETYGQFGYYDLRGGNDVLFVSNAATTAYGGTGDDTFQITQGGLFGLSLHGGPSATVLDTGPPESDNNTVDFAAAGTLSFDEIDGITNFKFSGNGSQFIFLGADQLPPGSAFHVTGSASRANGIAIDRGDTVGALHLNLSHVTLTNFGRLNQSFTFDLTGDVPGQNDSVVGVLNARDVFDFGAGRDSAVGGNKADVFFGGRGNDFFNGRGGIDVATFSGASSKYVITQLGAHTYSVHDIRFHSPEGTDVVTNVEYLAFANKYVFIGDLHA